MLEKIKKDKFYSKYYQETKDLKMLEKAGFFNDNIDNLEYNIDFLCTPMNKLKLKKNVINYVILTTGSYSPVHEGHISLLELSRNKLTELGHHVAGAYISPSHDSYVSVKNNGISKKHILERISLINEKIYKSDFIMLDPWEGCFTPKAINFTDVILRLEEYLTYYTKHNIKVIYAYGSDNYEFGLIFKDRFSICVERSQRYLQQVDNNVIYIQESEFKDLSSTKIREQYNIIQNNGKQLKYLIRDDSSFNNWKNLDYNKFKHSFIKIVQNVINNHQAEYIDIPDQLKKMSEIGLPSISLDKYFKGDVNLDVSRLFELSDVQYYNEEYNCIDKKFDTNIDYVIVDDDIVTGRTIDYIAKKYNLNIVRKIGLNNLLYDSHEIYDIVDLRDFIFGFPAGGLMVKWQNNIFRIPYIYPFVNIEKRAKIEASKLLSFSKDIIDLNIELFSNTNIKIYELDPDFIKFCHYLEFSKDMLVIDFLFWLKSKYFV